MASVTGRISTISQPQGGFIPLSLFEIHDLQDENSLSSEENVPANIIGLAVDYLTRYQMGLSKKKAFEISIEGSAVATFSGVNDALDIGEDLLKGIKKGLNSDTIINACKLVSFDDCARSGKTWESKSLDEINPNEETVQNIRILVQRSMKFFTEYGPIMQMGFDFSPPKQKISAKVSALKEHGIWGGYTSAVTDGDGDYLTQDTLWDMKVMRGEPQPKHTLQLVMYWIMGQHSGQEVFIPIKWIGIFNPRMNRKYILDSSNIPPETLKYIEDHIICYR